jgi:hypothetical protein
MKPRHRVAGTNTDARIVCHGVRLVSLSPPQRGFRSKRAPRMGQPFPSGLVPFRERTNARQRPDAAPAFEIAGVIVRGPHNLDPAQRQGHPGRLLRQSDCKTAHQKDCCRRRAKLMMLVTCLHRSEYSPRFCGAPSAIRKPLNEQLFWTET